MLLLALNAVGFVCSLVVLLTAYRVFHIARKREVSIRTCVAGVVGAGAASSIATALTEPLHLSHVLLLLGCSMWVIQAVIRRRRAEQGKPMRRGTDFAELDSLTTRRQTP